MARRKRKRSGGLGAHHDPGKVHKRYYGTGHHAYLGIRGLSARVTVGRGAAVYGICQSHEFSAHVRLGGTAKKARRAVASAGACGPTPTKAIGRAFAVLAKRIEFGRL